MRRSMPYVCGERQGASVPGEVRGGRPVLTGSWREAGWALEGHISQIGLP